MDQQNRSDPVSKARDLGVAIIAAADELERTRRIPAALLEQLHGSRLLRMLLPRSVGGDQIDPMTYFAAIEELAAEYGIGHIRFPSGRFDGVSSGGSVFRSVVLGALQTVNRRRKDARRARFLGLEASGRLDLGYFERVLPSLPPGEGYELMCHPGEYDPAEVTDARQRRYHGWEGELRTLTSAELPNLLMQHGVRLIGYRDLEIRDAHLSVRSQALAAA